MSITTVEAFEPSDAADPSWGLVRVSDEGGTTGWAEHPHAGADRAWVAQAARAARILEGADPLRVNANLAGLTAARDSGGLDRIMVSAIEIALHDLAARLLQVPVHDLLGGRYRDHIAVARSLHVGVPVGTASDSSNVSGDVAAALEAGFQTLKVVVSTPASPEVDRARIEATVASVAAVRERVGPNVGLIVDAGHSANAGAVIRLARGLEVLDIIWLEVDGLTPAMLRRVARQTRLRLCHGRGLGRTALLPALEAHATDVVIVDAGLDGLAEARRRSELAAHFDVMSTTSGAPGPMGLLADVQLASATPAIERLGIDGTAWDGMGALLDTPLVLDGGSLVVPTGSGLGAAPRADRLRRLTHLP